MFGNHQAPNLLVQVVSSLSIVENWTWLLLLKESLTFPLERERKNKYLIKVI